MRKLGRSKIYIIMFIVIICLPRLIWPFVSKYMDSENYENRTLTPRPIFDIDTYGNYAKKYEAYFNDNLPFRNNLITLNSWINYCFFRTSTNSNVILGKEKWLFYGNAYDGNPIADYEGSSSFSIDDIRNMTEATMKIQSTLEEMGIQSVIFVPTNKERIYAQYMPPKYTQAEKSRTDLMIELLQEQNVNIISPKSELLSWIPEYSLYYSYDTHWNQLGAYVGTCAILNAWGIETTDLSELTILTLPLKENYHVCAVDDLANMLHLRDSVFDDEVEYQIQECPVIDWPQTLDGTLHFENKEAPNHARVFLVGDSFRMSMLPALCMYFSDVYAIDRHNGCSYAMLEEIMPDYLILEYVERYSNQLLNIEQILETNP